MVSDESKRIANSIFRHERKISGKQFTRLFPLHFRQRCVQCLQNCDRHVQILCRSRLPQEDHWFAQIFLDCRRRRRAKRRKILVDCKLSSGEQLLQKVSILLYYAENNIRKNLYIFHRRPRCTSERKTPPPEPELKQSGHNYQFSPLDRWFLILQWLSLFLELHFSKNSI